MTDATKTPAADIVTGVNRDLDLDAHMMDLAARVKKSIYVRPTIADLAVARLLGFDDLIHASTTSRITGGDATHLDGVRFLVAGGYMHA